MNLKDPTNLADKVTIEAVTIEDIPGIAKVLDRTLGQDFRYGALSFEENVEYSFSRSIGHKHEGVYIAKLNSEVVGFAWFMNHPPNNGTAILEMFAVHKDKQRQGIGTRLITEAGNLFVQSQQELGCNLRTLHLTTNFSNGGAQTIYGRAGYHPVGLIPGFVGEGNVEVVMLKQINSEKAPEEYVTK